MCSRRGFWAKEARVKRELGKRIHMNWRRSYAFAGVKETLFWVYHSLEMDSGIDLLLQKCSFRRPMRAVM